MAGDMITVMATGEDAMRVRMIIGEEESAFDIPNAPDLRARFVRAVQETAAGLAEEAESRDSLSSRLSVYKDDIDNSFAKIASAVDALKKFQAAPEIS